MAQDLSEKLTALGIAPATAEDSARYAETFKLARHVRHSGQRALGLIPANDRVAAAPAAIQLGLALRDAATATVAFFDGNPKMPALAKLPVDGQLDDDYALVELADRLTGVTPRYQSAPGARDAMRIGAALARTRERFDYVLADLTGFERFGEARWAYDLLDAVVIVARSKATREGDVRKRHRTIPADRDLGVLIVG